MARDIFHDLVRAGLENEGWTITDDPYFISLDSVNFQVDLAAERIIAAQKDNEKIAVEIKSFLNASAVTDFYAALGQFLSYRLVLQKTEPERRLYLAVPLDTYEMFFQSTFAQLAVREYQLKIIIYDSQNGGLTQWIN
ncbi:fatty-acid oxidation protein subunit alpha (plasmid) [Euhalothece natronophila Z-M001]|uniref:Fatty-acid oxidation protein subunit alpha n=1 Tax=Euhalothece natronophila Z-M001 TaxID=522448 RepID=A0A5B8NR12_9CHRO|nr:element excision factor XisH family protein [Euhalothece natronophila]QDZ41642.1 fatty-acid oxidation protein subunit alpha [Euhalothece natronophila Z-M001]